MKDAEEFSAIIEADKTEFGKALKELGVIK